MISIRILGLKTFQIKMLFYLVHVDLSKESLNAKVVVKCNA